MVVGYQYQDYNKINFDMLCDMQLQITEMKRWQEKINSLKAITNGGARYCFTSVTISVHL